MQIELLIDKSLKEPHITVRAPELSPEIQNLLNKLGTKNKHIIGIYDEKLKILETEEIVNIYSENQRVFAFTADKTKYQLKTRLYEAEEILAGSDFVRISNSEIVNFKMVKNLDLSLNGTICLNLKNSGTCFVSRRYVPKIKQYLGI